MTVSVLNCTAGDLKLSFDSANPLEVERARRCVTDMLRRGYVLFIHNEDGTLSKVEAFDEKTDEYIIAVSAEAGEPDPVYDTTPIKEAKPTVKKATKKRVSAKKTKATGVAPTAGG